MALLAQRFGHHHPKGNAMKKLAVMLMVLVLGLAAVAQTSQKVIKDPAEYNAYMAALNTTDPAAKAAAMEAFVAQYPNSVVKIDALEQAMGGYQQTGNAAKVETSAGRIVELEPENVRALAILAFLRRARATQGDTKAGEEALAYAQRGLQALPGWTKPADMPQQDYDKLRQTMTSLLNGAAGFGRLQAKDYAGAREYYLKAVAADPSSLQDVYQLGIAELQMQPLDVNGFWYVARAMQLAGGNAAGRQSIEAYGKAKYRKYHGGTDGWDQLVLAVASQSAPPADFAQSIKPAPTPAELAVQAVQQNDPATLSFSDWEYILQYRDASPANREAAAKVWAVIQEKQQNGKAKLKLPMMVISATQDTILGAITEDNQASHTPDVKVILAKPLAHPPAAGAQIQVIGVFTDYTPSPFLFTMRDGELP
ncbi:MAG TPA: hypothetical protein VLT85_12140 [Terriglobales bacterium]|nr:hypothetical protein [Terriglobales bacterium]